MAKAGLTVRRTCRADAKAELSEPTIRIRCGRRLSDKSYSRDNRLVPPKSSYRRRSSAPRCRLILSWGWRRSQGFGCSPIKKVRELGSDRSEDDCAIDARSYTGQSESLGHHEEKRDTTNHGARNEQSSRSQLTNIGEARRAKAWGNTEGSRVISAPVETTR
jgi:hypothetical protein